METEKVDNKAKEVLAQNYIISPPVNVYEIARNYGLDIIEIPFEESINSIAGYIDIKKNRIYVNTNDTANRRKFTLAHELGHWLLHKDKLKEDPDYAILYRIPIGGTSDPIEMEANRFAAELLVPKEMLTKYYPQHKNNLSALANIFQVSQDVIGYRIKDLKLEDVQELIPEEAQQA